MKTAWGSKSPNRRRRVVLRTKVRWDKLGLQEPIGSTSAPSIDDLRRQITSAASQGLSPDTVSRSRREDGRPGSGANRSGSTRKRNPAS
ncbi:MAG TPA: hypothetical protein PKD12_23565 [Nitrospira sp.]|nr:hypothetical protein [Nitrospira sp.]